MNQTAEKTKALPCALFFYTKNFCRKFNSRRNPSAQNAFSNFGRILFGFIRSRFARIITKFSRRTKFVRHKSSSGVGSRVDFLFSTAIFYIVFADICFTIFSVIADFVAIFIRIFSAKFSQFSKYTKFTKSNNFERFSNFYNLRCFVIGGIELRSESLRNAGISFLATRLGGKSQF